MPKILDIWLVEVPDYALFFCRWYIVTNIVSTFATAFYIPMMAAGKVKTNSYVSVLLGVGKFLLLYILWKFGLDVEWVQYLAVIQTALYGFIVKPYILVNECEGYSYKEIFECMLVCCKMTLLSLILPSIVYMFMDKDSLLQNAVLVVIAIISVASSSLIFMESSQRQKLLKFALDKIRRY